MDITDVKVFPRQEKKLKAYVAVTFDDVFVVRNLKIIEGQKGLFVAMPSRKMADGSYIDIVHPLNGELRRELEERILSEYKKEFLLKEFFAMPGVQERQEAFGNN